MYRSHASFFTGVPKYHIILNAIINGIFKISVSDCLLLVYRNTVDFGRGRIFIFHSVTLLYLPISSSSFFFVCVDSVGFFRYTQSCLRIKMGLIPLSNLNAFYIFFFFFFWSDCMGYNHFALFLIFAGKHSEFYC